ncbi:hypothetical protein [Rhodococcus tibetensis]|uniref:Uncharacterized protein n=1 Tax=Rhodococcus tibetensis TaxID=2965064 RepID=A0ABT1QBT3_9NOCA|nr:hypothetical protein [Rhodococcus sp. FXJ9.536]MCQ4119701.1 hypothetical protein [Rhodococcus sp. FXJ9.536]
MTTVFVRVSVLSAAIAGTAALQRFLGRVGTRRTRGAPFHPNG